MPLVRVREVSMEFRRAAVRDAERAKLMRLAASLLAQMDRALLDADVEMYTVSAAVAIWELQEAARECEADALVEYEDTNPIGIKP
jgi:hypothetical protein